MAILYQGLASLFIKNFSRRFISPDIWVSNIPAYRGIIMAGRPGVQLSYLSKNSIAGHYMIFKDHLMTCIVSNYNGSKYLGNEANFSAALKDQLAKIVEICSVTIEKRTKTVSESKQEQVV